MVKNSTLILVDGDVGRRAAITHCLGNTEIHVEPYEDIYELIKHWPTHGILLIHDSDSAPQLLFDYMAQAGQWLPVICFSENPATRQVVRTVADGALDYMSWPFDAAEVIQVLEEVEHEATVRGSSKLRESLARSRVERLTKREREVLECVASGLSNRLIADKLVISPRTVELHRSSMLNRMGVSHTSEAIRLAIEANLAANSSANRRATAIPKPAQRIDKKD